MNYRAGERDIRFAVMPVANLDVLKSLAYISTIPKHYPLHYCIR